MKKLILTTIIAVGLFSLNNLVHAEAQTKEVCETVKDPKSGKEKQKCKTIKVHKKLEGTPVPEKKK